VNCHTLLIVTLLPPSQTLACTPLRRNPMNWFWCIMLCAYNSTYHIHCSFSEEAGSKSEGKLNVGGKCQNHLDFSMICSFFGSRLIKVLSNFSHIICIWGGEKYEGEDSKRILAVSKSIKLHVKLRWKIIENFPGFLGEGHISNYIDY
jgi:hypothetical protein